MCLELLPPPWCTGISLAAALHLSPSLSLSHMPPKGLRRIEITPPLHAVVLWSFRIWYNVVYFRNLG
jgi:hypothetical protein